MSPPPPISITCACRIVVFCPHLFFLIFTDYSSDHQHTPSPSHTPSHMHRSYILTLVRIHTQLRHPKQSQKAAPCLPRVLSRRESSRYAHTHTHTYKKERSEEGRKHVYKSKRRVYADAQMARAPEVAHVGGESVPESERARASALLVRVRARINNVCVCVCGANVCT